MIWNKFTGENRSIHLIQLLAVTLVFISLFMRSNWFFSLACFFLIVIWANQLYLWKAGMGLNFENIIEKHHFFIEDQGNWTLTFQNDGFPILKGELKISFDICVTPLDEHTTSIFSQHDLSIPISLFTNQTKKVTIPFEAKRRGVARIRHMEFRIPSLIGFSETILEYRPTVSQDAVVYPKRIPVKGLTNQYSLAQGAYPVPFSVYEERLGPLGTRDYVPADSFNRIHWKASARKQTLQTKVFERIAEKSWILSVNIADGYGTNEKLELLLSSVAEFAYYALQKNIPYSLCVNVRTAGSTPFMHLPRGEGKEQLQRVLEALASINLKYVYPYEKMIAAISNHFSAPAFYLHAGFKSSQTDLILYRIKKKGSYLMGLNVDEDGFGSISPIDFQKEGRMVL